MNMDKKTLFTEALTGLVEFAAAQNNEITSDDVKLYLKDFVEDESQYQFVYDYLAVNKIKVDGKAELSGEASPFFEAETTGADMQPETADANATPEWTTEDLESEEELAFIQMYMDDLDAILPVFEGEMEQLVEKLLADDLSVVDRLIECHLSTVAEIAEKYRGNGVSFGDLIQEGNMGLMLAISDYHTGEGAFDAFIRNRITAAIEATINTQIHSDRIGKRLADKLNQLDKVTKDLSEKFGRVPAVSELAEAMSITEEEVSLLLKTSLDTLSVNEDTQITEAAPSKEASPAAPKGDPLQWRVNKK